MVSLFFGDRYLTIVNYGSLFGIAIGVSLSCTKIVDKLFNADRRNHDGCNCLAGRENKFRLYRSIPAFTEYLFVEQNEFFIEVYRKQSEGWLLQDYSDLEQSIPISFLDINLPMTEIYRGF
ncbi:MAG: Uma2 family endonuclease [Limnothrix sp. RL_2_0]|nr:Uma2 family endonuclease [Limnothrix sp. RL_2_0]